MTHPANLSEKELGFLLEASNFEKALKEALKIFPIAFDYNQTKK